MAPAMPDLLRTSGNVLADRRYAYAKGAFDDGDWSTAADLAAQAVELAPDFAPAHALHGRAEAALGHREPAVTALRQALSLEPDDPMGVRIDLAQLGALAPEEAVTPAYVRALFDDYAPRFDRHLTKSLNYRGPELLADALRRAASKRLREPVFRLVLDLGCGTGLMGAALEGRAARIEGVDLSPQMLAKAAKTGVYDALHEGELVSFLQGRAEGEADGIIAADVFVYMADLAPVFAEARRVLAPGGFFAFTVQAGEGDGYRLGEDARYAHGERYLTALAQRTGFTIVLFEEVSTREDRGRPVPGYLAVLERA